MFGATLKKSAGGGEVDETMLGPQLEEVKDLLRDTRQAIDAARDEILDKLAKAKIKDDALKAFDDYRTKVTPAM